MSYAINRVLSFLIDEKSWFFPNTLFSKNHPKLHVNRTFSATNYAFDVWNITDIDITHITTRNTGEYVRCHHFSLELFWKITFQPKYFGTPLDFSRQRFSRLVRSLNIIITIFISRILLLRESWRLFVSTRRYHSTA